MNLFRIVRPIGSNWKMNKAAILLLLLTVAQLSAANPIDNPSFEDADLSTYFAVYWTGSVDFSLSDSISHSGSQSLKVTGTNGSSSVWQEVTVSPNTDYSMSVWIKTSGLSGVGITGLEIKSNSTYYFLSGDTQSNEWQEVTVDFNTGDATELQVSCAFEMYGNGTGTAYFDNLLLEAEAYSPPTIPDPPYTLTFGAGTSGKRGFFLNDTWFNPVVLSKQPTLSAGEIAAYKAEGINALNLMLTASNASSANVATYLNNCRDNGMPVIVHYQTEMWTSGWLAASANRNLELSPDHPGANTHVEYFPDYANSEVQTYVQNEITTIVNALSAWQHSPIMAFIIGPYDYYLLPDGVAHAQFNTQYPHTLGEGNQTWVPYGTHITTDFRQYLTDHSVAPNSIGYNSISEAAPPRDKFSANNYQHWTWWIKYRRFFVKRYSELVINKFKSLSDLPVTGTYDINFSTNDNYASPISELSDSYDFFILYYYSWTTPYNDVIPSLLEVVSNELERAGKPAITMFEFSSQIGPTAINISDYLSESLPYVGGFHYHHDISEYDNFLTSIRTFHNENIWDEQPSTANLAIFMSPGDIFHWREAYLSGRFLNSINYPYDVIYDYADFADYSDIYIPPSQPNFVSDETGQAAVQAFKDGGGTILSTLDGLTTPVEAVGCFLIY